MTLQQIIQRYRQNSGLSYEAIARQLDVSRSTVCRWASGEIRTVQSETKQRLSALIRHDVDALLEQEARFLEKPVLQARSRPAMTCSPISNCWAMNPSANKRPLPETSF